jgi:hypothetical protein
MNAQITRWFDEGHAKEAILGGEPFFVPETTFRDRHDRVLVLDQLLLWAVERGRATEARSAILDALKAAAADADHWGAYDLVWSYLLVIKDHETVVALDSAEILAVLDELDAASDPPEDVVELRHRVRDELATAT